MPDHEKYIQSILQGLARLQAEPELLAAEGTEDALRQADAAIWAIVWGDTI